MDLLEKIRQEGHVIKTAPFSFLVFLVVGCCFGYAASTWFYAKQITDRDQDIHRYRIALGIDKGSVNALVELNNEELQGKALNIATKARDLCFSFQKRAEQISPAVKGNKKEEKENFDRNMALMKEVGQEFDHDMKADFLNANNEVMRRLDPKALASVVRGPIFSDAETGTPIGMASLTPDQFEAPFLCTYADQLEQMAK
jgi:hypothetical protein